MEPLWASRVLTPKRRIAATFYWLALTATGSGGKPVDLEVSEVERWTMEVCVNPQIDEFL